MITPKVKFVLGFLEFLLFYFKFLQYSVFLNLKFANELYWLVTYDNYYDLFKGCTTKKVKKAYISYRNKSVL